MTRKPTAGYKVIPDKAGNRYQFFCDLSGASVCTTGPIRGGSPSEELALAWEREGREQFNRCSRCGRWVIDPMYNAEVLECVDCAPYEWEPRYCRSCGAKIQSPGKFCAQCGSLLIYEGGVGQNEE